VHHAAEADERLNTASGVDGITVGVGLVEILDISEVLEETGSGGKDDSDRGDLAEADKSGASFCLSDPCECLLLDLDELPQKEGDGLMDTVVVTLSTETHQNSNGTGVAHGLTVLGVVAEVSEGGGGLLEDFLIVVGVTHVEEGRDAFKSD